MQLDMFATPLPPVFEQLAGLDINMLTPLQAMQILEELVAMARKLKS
jgi:hypothetical protein